MLVTKYVEIGVDFRRVDSSHDIDYTGFFSDDDSTSNWERNERKFCSVMEPNFSQYSVMPCVKYVEHWKSILRYNGELNHYHYRHQQQPAYFGISTKAISSELVTHIPLPQ